MTVSCRSHKLDLITCIICFLTVEPFLETMGRLPAWEPNKNIIHSPQVVILGAGASKAAWPLGDKNGRIVPVMAELFDCLQLEDVFDIESLLNTSDFEKLFDELLSSGRDPTLVAEIETRIGTVTDLGSRGDGLT